MFPSRHISKLVGIVGLASLLLFVPLLLQPVARSLRPEDTTTSSRAGNGGGELTLAAPAFFTSVNAAPVQEDDFSVVLEEAGVTAYTKLDQELDLDYLAARLKSVQQKSSRYVAGIMPAPGYEDLSELEESGEVQVFLHQDGWIVVYLSRWQPASALLDWVNYDEKRLDGTLIESAVRSLVDDIGVTDYTVSYFDFRNPDATSLILAADRADGTTLSDSFQVTIPRGLKVYEASWAHGRYSKTVAPSSCKVDEQELSAVMPNSHQWKYTTGEFDDRLLAANKAHEISLTTDWNWNEESRMYCGIAILYSE